MPLTRERLQTILDRLASGYYDRRDVQREIAQRLATDVIHRSPGDG